MRTPQWYKIAVPLSDPGTGEWQSCGLRLITRWRPMAAPLQEWVGGAAPGWPVAVEAAATRPNLTRRPRYALILWYPAKETSIPTDLMIPRQGDLDTHWSYDTPPRRPRYPLILWYPAKETSIPTVLIISSSSPVETHMQFYFKSLSWFTRFSNKLLIKCCI